MSYPGHSLGEFLPLCREAVGIFYNPSRLGNQFLDFLPISLIFLRFALFCVNPFISNTIRSIFTKFTLDPGKTINMIVKATYFWFTKHYRSLNTETKLFEIMLWLLLNLWNLKSWSCQFSCSSEAFLSYFYFHLWRYSFPIFSHTCNFLISISVLMLS